VVALAYVGLSFFPFTTHMELLRSAYLDRIEPVHSQNDLPRNGFRNPGLGFRVLGEGAKGGRSTCNARVPRDHDSPATGRPARCCLAPVATPLTRHPANRAASCAAAAWVA
jgi:hypothetical protein